MVMLWRRKKVHEVLWCRVLRVQTVVQEERIAARLWCRWTVQEVYLITVIHYNENTDWSIRKSRRRVAENFANSEHENVETRSNITRDINTTITLLSPSVSRSIVIPIIALCRDPKYWMHSLSWKNQPYWAKVPLKHTAHIKHWVITIYTFVRAFPQKL